MVAKTIERFNRTGSTQNRPCHGQIKKLSSRAPRHIQRLCLANRRMSAASIPAEVKGVGGQPVSSQTICHTLHQIGLHGCHSWRKPLLKMMNKKACKQFAEDKQTKYMDNWNHVLWSDETKINSFGSDGVKRVWRQPDEEYKDNCVLPTVKHGGGSVMVWGCTSAAGSGELQFICICGASSNGRWRSARSLTSTSSVMSSWRSGRGLQWQPVKLWGTPCPRGLRQCWKKMVATQNIDTLGPVWTFSLCCAHFCG